MRKGTILLFLGIVLTPLGLIFAFTPAYGGPGYISGYPFAIPGIIMFIFGCVFIATGIYYLIKRTKEQ